MVMEFIQIMSAACNFRVGNFLNHNFFFKYYLNDNKYTCLETPVSLLIG